MSSVCRMDMRKSSRASSKKKKKGGLSFSTLMKNVSKLNNKHKPPSNRQINKSLW